MKLTFIEMFCGIGGFRLGLERNGWKCVWANDVDKYACYVYRKNFGCRELADRLIDSASFDKNFAVKFLVNLRNRLAQH